jgi:hypothetical protein
MWFAVIICALIIFVGWIFSLKYTIKGAVEKNGETKIIPQDAKETFKEFKNQIPAIKGNIETGVENLFQEQQNEPSPFERQNQE